MAGFNTLSGVRPQTINRPAMPVVDRRLIRPDEPERLPQIVLPPLPPIEEPRVVEGKFIPPKPVTPGQMIGGRRVGEGEVVYTVADMLAVAVQASGIGKTEMLSDRRAARLVRARQVGMWLAKHFTGRSLPFIGKAFGGRDHTTVLYAVRRVEHAIVSTRVTLVAEPLDIARELLSVDWPRVPK